MLRPVLRFSREEPLQMDGDLGDGLEDAVAVAALVEVVVQVPVHRLPEGPGRDPVHFISAYHRKGAAPRGNIDENGRGSLVLG